MKKLTILILLTCSISATYAQVGINADNSAPHSSAQLDVKSTTKAFYPPRMTTAQKNAIASPQAGAVVFDNTLNQLNFYNGTSWMDSNGSGFTLPYLGVISSNSNLLYLANTNTTQNLSTIYGATNSSTSAEGIRGAAVNSSPTNNTIGILGLNKSLNSFGYGVQGVHEGAGVGVYGEGKNEYGVGVYGIGEDFGVKGESSDGYSTGVYGISQYGYGVQGVSPNGWGAIFTSSSGHAALVANGKVGIGVSFPNYILDVISRIRIRHTIDDSPDDNTAGIWYNNSANVEGAFSGMKTDTEVGLFLGGNWRFWVNSGGQGYLNGALIQTSDKRLKKDFSKLNNSLSNIYKLNGYHFKWKEEARNKDLQTGLIAQEVQKILPELVETNDKGFLSVNYIGLIPHLIEAVKELKNENNSLKLENNLIKTENNSFKNNQTKLESRIDKMETLLNSFSKNTTSN